MYPMFTCLPTARLVIASESNTRRGYMQSTGCRSMRRECAGICMRRAPGGHAGACSTCAGSMHAPVTCAEHAGPRLNAAGVCTRRAPSMHAPDTSAQPEEYAPEHARAMPGRRPRSMRWSMHAPEYACAGIALCCGRVAIETGVHNGRLFAATAVR
jgi:hypothetical protein